MQDLQLNLTIEQEFMLQTYVNNASQLSAEEARKLLIEAAKLCMVKDNVIRQLMKQTPEDN